MLIGPVEDDCYSLGLLLLLSFAVGRGLPAWRFFYPQLQEAFPAQFGDVELNTYYGAINKVEPSFIRVEADEATYNMHVILRFELEQEILSGALPLEDLPVFVFILRAY